VGAVFTKDISTEIEIEGTPEEVWGVLADLPKWPEWNPGVKSMEGELAMGSRLRFSSALKSGRQLKFRPRVLVVEPGRELRWLGRVIAPGLFDGWHRHQIRASAPGRVTYVQSERFRGLLVPFLRRMIEQDTVESFQATNEALASRVAEVRAWKAA
jgi:hypothetical protein